MRALALLIATCLVASSAVSARELVPAEKRIIPYDANISLCQDAGVLEEISTRFAEKEAKFWRSDLTLVEYARIQPLAYRPWGLDTIPRRFCTASVLVSDGRWRRVNYSVREALGFSGVGDGVEFCVTGLDRNLAYAPLCKEARP